MSFQINQSVEVCYAGDHSCAETRTYCPAAITDVVAEDLYCIVYQNRGWAERHIGWPNELIRGKHMRPEPPRLIAFEYEVSTMVDVYVDGAWRKGKVTRKEGHGYMVKLDNVEQELYCIYNHIRIHQDWLGDKWLVELP